MLCVNCIVKWVAHHLGQAFSWLLFSSSEHAHSCHNTRISLACDSSDDNGSKNVAIMIILLIGMYTLGMYIMFIHMTVCLETLEHCSMQKAD